MNNTNIQSDLPKVKSRLRLPVLLTLVFLLPFSIVMTDYFADKRFDSSGKSGNIQGNVSDMNNVGDYRIFENEDGYFGIADKDERVIIEPVWNKISILDNEKYIVATVLNGKVKSGIIDNNANVVIPLMFESFKTLNSVYIAGYLDNEKFMLFDKNGRPVSEKCWTDYEYSDDLISLKYGNDEYCIRNSGDNFEYASIILYRDSCGIPVKFALDDDKIIENVGVHNFERIAYITDRYLNYLITGGVTYNISDITTEQYQSTLLVNDLFRDCNVNNIQNFDIKVKNEENNTSYAVRVIVEYDYQNNDVGLKDISSEITLNIVTDENNRLVLKSINKVEL